MPQLAIADRPEDAVTVSCQSGARAAASCTGFRDTFVGACCFGPRQECALLHHNLCSACEGSLHTFAVGC